MADPSNPNDPQYAGDPEHYVFVNGRWQYRDSAASGNATDPNGSNKTYATNVGTGGSLAELLGLGSMQLGAEAPGAELPTGQGDAERDRLAPLLQQLQGQASTGGGAWEQALAANTHATQASASALGQSQHVDPLTAARNIGNAQAGAAQRAVGQGNLLRAQSQQSAAGSIAALLGGQGALDAQQAGAQAGARQGRQETNSALQQNTAQNTGNFMSGVGQAFTSLLSHGGEVPGVANVPGDDPRNDTVPARSTQGADLLLSPDEIVLPRSVTLAPDAPSRAAAFVAAVKAHYPQHKSNFDSGGEISPYGALNPSRQLQHDSSVGEGHFTAMGTTQAPAGIGNGGLLDTTQYNQSRDASLANAAHFMDAAAGRGHSVAPQAMQNAQDSTLAEALRQEASSRGMRRGAAAGNTLAAATEQIQGAAGNSAGLVAGESQRGAQDFAQAVNRQRAQDIALATAEQQAAWRNSQMNAGLGLAQQAQLRGLLGSAGQGAAAIAGMFTDDSGPSHDFDVATEHDNGESSHFADGGVVVNHLSRKGTHRPSGRPGRHESNEPRGLNTVTSTSDADESEWASFPKDEKEGKRLRDRITPPVVDSSWQGVHSRSYGTQTEDTQQFAGGGPVFFEGPSGTPPGPGPFDANVNAGTIDIGAALRQLQMLSMPTGGPSGTQDAPLTPQQQAARAAMAPNPQAPKPAAPPPLPHGSPTRERPAAAAPQPAAAQAPQQSAPQAQPVSPKGPDQYELARRAGEEKAAAETEQGHAQATALEGLQSSLQANAIQQNELHARAAEEAHKQLGALQAARDEMKALDVSVDPGHFWASRGTPGKIAAVIGLALGAVGNDGGVNRAAQLLSQAIDRDLDAQKAEHELRLRKGQSAVDSAQNIYALSRQATQDDIAANAAAKGTALDLAKNQVDLAIAKTAAPMAKANLSALSAQLAAKKEEADAALKQRGFDNSIKRQNADTDRMRAEADMAAAGNKAAVGDKAQQALLAQVGENYDVIQKSGAELKALIKKHGTGGGLTGPGRSEMQQLINDIATARAKLNDPSGQARASEVEAEARNFFQPGFLQSTETANKTIDSYLANSQKRRDAAFKERGQAAGSPTAKPGVKRMRLPSGEIVEVR